jgi:hypothetical protein
MKKISDVQVQSPRLKSECLISEHLFVYQNLLMYVLRKPQIRNTPTYPNDLPSTVFGFEGGDCTRLLQAGRESELCGNVLKMWPTRGGQWIRAALLCHAGSNFRERNLDFLSDFGYAFAKQTNFVADHPIVPGTPIWYVQCLRLDSCTSRLADKANQPDHYSSAE